MSVNRRWTLARRPEAGVSPDDFALVSLPLDEAPLAAGEVLVRNHLFSVAPTIRNRLKPPQNSHRGAIPLGGLIGGIAGCEIIASAHPGYSVGERIVAMSGWEDQSRLAPDALPVPVVRIDGDQSFDDALGPYSLNSLTAYFGLTEVGRPLAGETLLVSGAAGSVGSAACQIGKLLGCRVIGIAGGRDKCQWLRDSGAVDAAIDYRTQNLAERLADLAPNGIDLFFDNVGGDTLQAGVDTMARHGRIILCGQISAYDRPGGAPGPRDMMRIVYGAIRLQGFVVGDFASQFGAARAQLRQWVESGRFHARIDRRDGLLQLPTAFADLFRGANQGTLLVANDGEWHA